MHRRDERFQIAESRVLSLSSSSMPWPDFSVRSNDGHVGGGAIDFADRFRARRPLRRRLRDRASRPSTSAMPRRTIGWSSIKRMRCYLPTRLKVAFSGHVNFPYEEAEVIRDGAGTPMSRLAVALGAALKRSRGFRGQGRVSTCIRPPNNSSRSRMLNRPNPVARLPYRFSARRVEAGAVVGNAISDSPSGDASW